jgi:hypothetical protein
MVARGRVMQSKIKQSKDVKMSEVLSNPGVSIQKRYTTVF